jgi:hypothetical protein
MATNCHGKCNNCDESTSDHSDEECTSKDLDCGSDSDLDWNVVVRQITNCKIDESGKKRCKKERVIEDRSHEQVCFWTQTIPVYLRYYGDLLDGSGFQSFPLNQPLKFIASGNTLVVQATNPCVTDSLNFTNGVVIIPPCDQKPQRRPGDCNKIVNFQESAYFITISSYETFELKVGTTIKAVNGTLVFANHEIHCLCDLIEYQEILQQNNMEAQLGAPIVSRSNTASGSPSNNPGSGNTSAGGGGA